MKGGQWPIATRSNRWCAPPLRCAAAHYQRCMQALLCHNVREYTRQASRSTPDRQSTDRMLAAWLVGLCASDNAQHARQGLHDCSCWSLL